jgi:hypothetical protein
MLEFRTQGHQEPEGRSATACYLMLLTLLPIHPPRSRGRTFLGRAPTSRGDALSFNWLVQMPLEVVLGHWNELREYAIKAKWMSRP